MTRRPATVALVAAVALATSACGGRTTAQEVHHRLLAAADLPSGWSETPVDPKALRVSAPCLSGLAPSSKDETSDAVAFLAQGGVPTLNEALATGPASAAAFRRFDHALATCRAATMTIAGTKVPVAIRHLSLPTLSGVTSAYAWRFVLGGLHLQSDVLLLRSGPYVGELSYSDVGAPTRRAVEAFAKAAIAKATTGSTAPVPAAISIASATVQTVHTTLGTVAYRAVGSGPPLVLVTGFGGTMESWDRRFVDALAAHHRVVTFDNAGIGGTDALPAPLTVDAMANQTSALISALGLGRADVLGWSMGSMIAQALAVLHPAQVRRLILCASYPGNGSNVRPAQAAIDDLKSGTPKRVMSALFPADQAAAQNAYTAALASYPPHTPVSADVLTAQSRAVDLWWAGTDPAGTRTAKIAARTLVADGAADRLDPAANSRTLAALIPGATLRLYPDAGHAFLFQDEASFLPLVESFLR